MEIDDIKTMLANLKRDTRIMRDALDEAEFSADELEAVEEGVLDLEDALSKIDDELCHIEALHAEEEFDA